MKNKLTLYIAMSVDGYIADQNGGIDFLYDTPAPEPDLDYEAFYASVQAIIFGGATYRQVKYELSPNQWPYLGMPCYVCTHRQNPDDPNVRFTQLPPKQLLDAVWREHPGNIWLMGGGAVIRSFLQENLIDEYYIYVQPIMLGNGIPLFPADFPKTSVRLISCKSIGEIVELRYQRDDGNRNEVELRLSQEFMK
ncbi:MAG: dihydrofolate reductase [Oscillibacter sp.]|jgi:dihydrofolate reductase|nr:dihydrofolate reductase family protein [uncultured Oscillibacter sp.]MCI8970574.1 dihydrofolate reductase [Oscillibacter sp.]